jgi:hypothetical protein
MMLPSEKIELAIYKAVNRGPGPVTFLTTMPMLSHITGEDDHASIADRLKALEADSRILLTKWSGGQRWPRGDSPDATFFYTGEFGVEIIPQGRKYFEELEQIAKRGVGFGKKSAREKSPSRSHAKSNAPVGPLVLISHSSKDRELATALIDLLKAGIGLLADQIRCSSVDGHRLPVGVDTASKLREEVNAAAVVIGLITPSSLSSHYVMFELGARWGANLFVAPLLAGVEAGTLSGPLSLLNALAANNELQLHQLLVDIGSQLGLRVQSPAAYLRNVSAVRALADAIPTTAVVSPVRVTPIKEKLKVTISAEGTPPAQVLRVVANRAVEVSRVEYMTTSEATIAIDDVSAQGGELDIPINYGCVSQLWNTPRPDRNHSDHSDPARIGVTVSADGDTNQHIVPVQMVAMFQNNTGLRKIVGSKTFYGS